MLHIKDKTAEEFLAQRAKEKKDNEVIFGLTMFLVKLDLWPHRLYQGKPVPVVAPRSVFKEFYKSRRRV